MARDPLRSYQNQMMNYGLGRAFADNRPVTRRQMIEAEFPDNPSSYADDIQRILKAGGLSGMNQLVPSKAFSLPNDIFEATAAVTEAGRVTPSSSYMQMDYGTGQFAPDGTPLGKPGTLIRGKGLTKPVPLGASDEAIAQSMIAKKEENKMSAEEFRANEAKIADMQGMPTGDPVETAFMAGMDEFIKAARDAKAPGATKVRDLEDYKKEFANATGLDVSGKVDKSQALMAFGLALMQNRAGKGFNIGKMLSAVGEAGQSAMPELDAARKEARANAAAAGKYALDMRSSDQDKAMKAALAAQQRGKYYIMPKSEGQSGFISVMDEAKPEFLNATELSALVTNPEFSAQYDVITEQRFSQIVDKVLDAPENPDTFTDKTSKIVLFSGTNVDDIFTFDVNNVNPNLPEKMRPSFGRLANPGVSDQIYEALGNALTDIDKFEDTFAGAIAAIDEDAATFGSQIQNALIQAVDTLGFDVDANTDTAELSKFLTKLQAQQAATILGEAGKTLSDKDRELVKEIVGALPGLLDGNSPDVLRNKLLQLKTQLIDNKRREIYAAFRTMDNYSREDTSALWSDEKWTKEDQKELEERRKKQGYKA